MVTKLSIRGILGMSLVFLLSFLTGCQAADSSPAGVTEEAESVVESQPPITAIPTTVPTSSPATRTTAGSASTPTDSPVEPGTIPAEVTKINESDNKANADVEFVRAVQNSDGEWTFHVTVRHPDTGWEDYADGWDVVTPDGAILKRSAADPFTRLLLHPHESEQPFTRSQSGLVMPEGVSQVTVRAHDLVDGFGGRQIVVDLNSDSGPGFEVERQ